MRIFLVILLGMLATNALAQMAQKAEFHPYLGRRVQTYMGPTAIQHPYADNREMKFVPQDKYFCEPIFALIDKNSFDKTVDLECVVFPFVYDRLEKSEVARLEDLRRNECFQLSIAKCELNDKKVWQIKSDPVTDRAQCEKLVASKKNKIEAAEQCQVQTSAPYKAEQQKLKNLSEQKKKTDEQAKLDYENSFSNLLGTRSIFDAGYETQGRYTLGYGYSLSKINPHNGIGTFYPFLQVAMNNKSIESYSLGVRLWTVYMMAINFHMAYEKVENGSNRLGLEAGMGFMVFTPYVGLASDFKGDLNLRLGVRIIFNSIFQ